MLKKIIRKIRRSFRLAVRSGFHYFVVRMLRHPPYHISINGKGDKIFAGGDSHCVSAYIEIIAEDIYGIFSYSKSSNPSVIVDIGANIGIFSKVCSLLFPKADIYSYEPNTNTLPWLRKNADKTHIKIHPYAVSEKSGTAKFYIDCWPGNARLDPNGALPVKCTTASNVAEGRPIDFLKMDCEGSEWHILQDHTLLSRTRRFSIEFHLRPDHTVEEIRDLVKKANHKILRLSSNPDGTGILWSKLKG